ncbi:GNAT family N-acetyltransferase [Marivita sp. S6314]|uniref:GNAT family N-acetyltransferase n=1 Tax=Marivita sp. S6314 TaxID=2926406 RepID=UPI001FF64AC8|nr:GNAT family N-acyltransferase [Marivita sp. S6314]MCK0148459.1 GNAT family N-acetyltransferase [Marivita sp. S6314]
MLQNAPFLHASLAQTEADIRSAQRLRYRVFVQEMGSDGPGVDHARSLETDAFDPYADHLLLRDSRLVDGDNDGVVGVYRLMTRDHAAKAGRFYSASEFDLACLTQTKRTVLELGRSCLHPKYRGGAGLLAMWQALAGYVAARDIDLMFGVASFRGTDLNSLLHPVSHLHDAYLAPAPIRVRSRMPLPMPLLPRDQINRKTAMRDTPALIKSYLKIGGVIGEGVYVDHAFNTVDVCLLLETDTLKQQGLARRMRSSA